MSYAVLRGSPDECQLYLDKIIDAILLDNPGKSGDQLNVAEVIFHCMKTNPGSIYCINAVTNEKFTNEQILKRAVSVARSATHACGSGTEKTAIIMVRNHEQMAAVYYAVLLAGVVPFMMEPNSTAYELQHFFSLISPSLVFCELDRVDDVSNTLEKSDVTANVVAADKSSLDQFTRGYSDDVDSFQLPNLFPDSPALMLPTSGSTGLPKAAILHHQGLVMQLASIWVYHSRFPQPTRLALLLSTPQWMTHSLIMTTCPVYQVPLLLSPETMTAEYVLELAEKYQPTWAFFGPALAAAFGHLGRPDQISSFETLFIGGSPFSPESIAPLKEKLPASSCILNGYGLTETQGLVARGRGSTPVTSVGEILNIFDYKIVNESGEDVTEPYQKGEVYLRSKCIFKGYLKNEAAYHESFTHDGWLKTGDIFYRDENDEMFFANRNKLGFKYLNHQIYPEEIERVISAVPGVQHCVVCGIDAGPAAAVVLFPGYEVTRDNIQQAVNKTLSDYKRLRGGIAFLSTLPRTHNGKIARASCSQLIRDLVNKGDFF